jgi:ubiquinone/menaquinone biosynthesis C-methylase UbiE
MSAFSAGEPRSFLNDGGHYDACHAYLVEDLPFWKSLARPGTSVLELACGTGRIAIPMAQSGAIVTGVEVNDSMLEHARRKSGAAGVAIEWIQGDMRSFSLPSTAYDLIAIGFNGINLLLSVDEALACLRCCRRHLAPRGRLVIDTFLPLPARLVDSDIPEKTASYVAPEDGAKIAVTGRRSYDPFRQIRHLDLTIQSSSSPEPGRDDLDIHVYFPQELTLLAMHAGFDVETMYGDYQMRPPRPSSSRCILVCRSPA